MISASNSGKDTWIYLWMMKILFGPVPVYLTSKKFSYDQMHQILLANLASCLLLTSSFTYDKVCHVGTKITWTL